jgi:hypothetical protein
MRRTKHFPILAKLQAEESMSAIQIFRLAHAGGWMEEMRIPGITDGSAIPGTGVEPFRYLGPRNKKRQYQDD